MVSEISHEDPHAIVFFIAPPPKPSRRSRRFSLQAHEIRKEELRLQLQPREATWCERPGVIPTIDESIFEDDNKSSVVPDETKSE